MSYSVNENAYIKIYRKLLNWEWYTDVNATKLFLHCLLKANWKPGRWKGISYEAGEFITSLPSLAKETGLTVRQVRTALTKLKSTGEVTDRVTGQNEPKGRVITVIKWHLYQGSDRISDRIVDRTATGLRQDDDRIATAEEEYKEYKEYKEPQEERARARVRGQFGNVILTDEQLNRLIEKYGEPTVNKFIGKIDRYCAKTKKTYANFEAAISDWIEQDNGPPGGWQPEDDVNADLRKKMMDSINERWGA